DQWSGQYPYVINATDGTVLQRLRGDTQPPPGDWIYMNNWAALSPNRTMLFLMDSNSAPVQLRSYLRQANGTWALGQHQFGPGDFAQDLTVSPDGQYLYAALLIGSFERIRVSDLQLDRTASGLYQGHTLALTTDGTRVAFAASDPWVHLY